MPDCRVGSLISRDCVSDCGTNCEHFPFRFDWPIVFLLAVHHPPQRIRNAHRVPGRAGLLEARWDRVDISERSRAMGLQSIRARTPKHPMTAYQADLFSPNQSLPEGFRYDDLFLHADEEAALATHLAVLPLQQAQYKEWSARRRIVSYGGSYDFRRHELLPAQPMPEFLLCLRTKAAGWAGIPAEQIDHALVAEYRPGTQLGWHRDVSEFALVIGISLLGAARMRLRRYPHIVGRRGLSIDLAPRSIYSLRGEARWNWQHAISPTKALRYSITFRTLRR